ncbi:tetratricopeptide repeat protein [Hyphobacterium indicum]|uniref:tetratricopeptide repeat protein n=1 Tax=Hyphobacterium indicum TaxID=2162714 RepID=UPI000D647F22|nr:tetratricopeptide repeat protein [Hyphobacterium indicum]
MINRISFLIVAAAFAFVAVAPSADAQRRSRNDEQQGSAEDRTMSAQMGEPILAAQECIDADNMTCVINTLTPLLGRGPNPYEQFVIYRMRGVAYYNQDRTDLAIRDFEAALATGAATPDESTSLRTNIGQLYIVTERYTEGINQLERAISEGANLTPSLAMLLSQAYAQAERFREGLRYAQHQFDNASPRERRNFDMLLLYFQQLERTEDQLRLITQMVERWPGERNIWTSLVALMAQTNNESGAFEANKLMYLNGMLSDERELVRLAQYYSYFEYPYRGAVILEREMNAGRVTRSRENLEILANMWRQAREYERAIPVLEAVAERGDGEDYLRLGEAYYQENRLAEAESAFESALARGGISRPGDTQALLGTVRYEQGNRQSALQAFRGCTQYSYSRRTCSGWVTFIQNEINAESERARLRIRVEVEECRITINSELVNVTIVGDARNFDDEGRAMVEVPERCQPYFNTYGDQIGGPGFEQAAAETEESETEAG